jgi:hypothetical protein
LVGFTFAWFFAAFPETFSVCKSNIRRSCSVSWSFAAMATIILPYSGQKFVLIFSIHHYVNNYLFGFKWFCVYRNIRLIKKKNFFKIFVYIFKTKKSLIFKCLVIMIMKWTKNTMKMRIKFNESLGYLSAIQRTIK